MPRTAPKPRSELLAEIATLPADAFISPALAAAYLNVTTGVLLSWRDQRRGPRYYGACQFARYKRHDLDAWMATRSGEVVPDGVAGHPRLVWRRDEHTQAVEQQSSDK